MSFPWVGEFSQKQNVNFFTLKEKKNLGMYSFQTTFPLGGKIFRKQI